MSKMTIFCIVAIAALAGSFAWNGFKTPRLTDDEYIRQYQILNADDATKDEILAKRKAYDIETEKWKKSNAILDEAMIKYSINLQSAQKAIVQMQWYDAYYNHNVTIERFIKVKYGK